MLRILIIYQVQVYSVHFCKAKPLKLASTFIRGALEFANGVIFYIVGHQLDDCEKQKVESWIECHVPSSTKIIDGKCTFKIPMLLFIS